MSTKVKGLLKGLRNLSQIFDEKEEEIQIGFPTDVKHVAHIGSDDPSTNAPSWMNEYKSEGTEGTENAIEKLEEHNNNYSSSKGSKIRHLIPKSRHQSIDNNDTNDSIKHKHTRRHRSSDPSSESSVHDSSSGGSRHSRQHRRGSNHGLESPSQDGMPPTATKPRRKSKTTTSEDTSSVRKPSSTRTSKRSSKGDSLTDISFTELELSGPGSENGHGSK